MSSGAQTCWAIVPVKAPGEGKTRLAGMLDARQRERLVAAMLKRVVDAARACPAIDRLCLVSSCDNGLTDGVTLLADHEGGLNAAITTALRSLAEPRPDRLIIAAADLPQITPTDFAMLADVPANAIGIAPDRHGKGTNALSLPVAVATAFHFQFGLGSYVAHRAEARRLGYSVDAMLSDGLEKDIDEPADLADAKDCLREAL